MQRVSPELPLYCRFESEPMSTTWNGPRWGSGACQTGTTWPVPKLTLRK